MNSANNKLRALLMLAVLPTGMLLAIFSRSGVNGQTTRRKSTTTVRKATRGINTPARSQSASPEPVRVPSLTQTQQPSPTPARPLTTAQTTTTPQPASESMQKATEETIDDDEVIRVTSNLVVVPVSATNEHGEPVQGLKAADFRLEEEGRTQEVAQVGDADQVPLDIAILFDVSSSISQRFEFEQQAAARFLKQVLKPIDRAAVFAIGQTPRLEQQLASAEIASAKLLGIPAPQKSTPTAFYDTTISAARYLAANAPGRHRRVIIVISDGDDNYSVRIKEGETADARALNRGEKLPANARTRQQETHRKALLEVQREVQRADAVFYSINPSGGGLSLNQRGTRAQTGMQQLADSTGGTSFKPEQLAELDNIFRQIANELRAQYLLQYYSTSDAPNGKFLTIKVRAPTRPDARVRARQGYYVKK
ncbi:MAG: VWA domain-containing protein [Pyrinomonadaceae bacterium]